MRRRSFLIVLVLLTQGCGIKGPLYIETAEQKRRAAERQEQREAAKQRDQRRGAVQTAPRGAGETPPAAAVSTDEADSDRIAPPTLTDESFGPSVPPPFQ